MSDRRSDAELFTEAYQKYLQSKASQGAFRLKTIEYAKYRFLPDPDRTPLAKRLFHWPANDFARELINACHSLLRLTGDIYFWEPILAEYRTEERLRLLVEFIEEKAQMALMKPYSIKNRFIHSAAMLGFLVDGNRRDRPVPTEGAINYLTLKTWLCDWEGLEDFLQKLGSLNGDDFIHATINFRNRSQHRMPPQIEFGVTPVISFSNASGAVSYTVGSLRPLPLKKIVEALEPQYSYAIQTMDAFWSMVMKREQRIIA